MIWADYNPLIKKAYAFAQQAHSGQKRISGEPCFSHIEATAETVAEWGMDEAAIAAALLHDVLEDTNVTSDQLENEFGDEISFLVNGVTKLGHIKYRGTKAEVENMRKFILAISKDVRVVIIKLADRLHNMETIRALPPQKQNRIAIETMEIYAQLAFQLGMFNVGGQLEDLAFPIIYPKENEWIIQHVNERYQERERYAQNLKSVIENELVQHNIQPISVDSRGKRRTSLYRKLVKYEMNLDRIYDLVAIRCILKSVEDCYAALGIIHGKWIPIPNRIKDYIALPKPNNYRSLHTTIFGPDKKIVEVQIRTQEMHDEAELGIAAHWVYKQKHKVQVSFAKQSELALMEQLRNWQKGPSNPHEFMQSFKIDVLQDKIMVLTPKGKIINLPQGSTPVDFAYQIHTEIGNSCIGARVNGRISPLDNQLQAGDVVEILTQKNKKPSEDWLNFVKTGQARNYIKTALRSKSNKLMLTPQKTELKLLVKDRIGILKDITGIISRSHINITDHNSYPHKPNDEFHVVKILLAVANKEKIDKVIAKLKKLEDIKSIDSRLVH